MIIDYVYSFLVGVTSTIICYYVYKNIKKIIKIEPKKENTNCYTFICNCCNSIVSIDSTHNISEYTCPLCDNKMEKV